MTERGFAPTGLVVALVGFGLTRFTVTDAAMGTTTGFLFTGLIPLVLGLGLSAAGVLLTVGRYDRMVVRTITVWCVAGTLGMAALVALTLLGSEVQPTSMTAVREQSYLSTFLIGGAVGGALTGFYAGRNRRYRQNLDERANRLVVLNRLLRDRVVNSATAVSGHQAILEDGHSEDSVEVIGRKADDIVETVERVKYLAETADAPTGRVDLVALVEREVSAIRAAHPDATVELDAPDEVQVRATDDLREAVRHLLVNAVVHSDSDRPRVEVEIERSRAEAVFRVSDSGPGLPESQQRLLEAGEIAEYDDPTTGFGLNVVRLLAERFDATVRADVTDSGTTVALSLPRVVDVHEEGGPGATAAGLSPSRAATAVGAGLVAGLTMAVAMAALDGDLLAIGALYGIENPVVAVITHEFHSVVFGLSFVALLAILPAGTHTLGRRLATGIVFGLSLWLFAAGLVMPVWLDLVGIAAPFPNLTVASLVAHIVWGTTVSLCYHAGDRWLDASRSSSLTLETDLADATDSAPRPQSRRADQ